MGSLAKANARYDITIGHQAGALSGEGPNSGNSGERVTIGSHATVGSNQAIRVDAGGSLGTVNLAVKSVGQSVAIGSGTGALPENRTYAYGDQSLAIGSDTLAYGDSSVAIGGDDLDKAGAQRISYTDPTNGNRVNGTVRQAYQTLTGDTMQDGVYIKTASKQAGVSVGIQAQSGDLGVALGAKSTASTASTAIGTGASANKDNAIALGAGSKTNTNATQVTSATVGGLTYGNFAGNSSVAVGDQVSVGNTGFERQIKHVAPGEISAASTDAINGSQLYATQKTLGNVGNTVKTILGGNAAIDADGNITMSNIGGTGQNTIHDAIQAAKTKVQAADNSPVTVTGTGSSTDPYKVGVNTVTLTAPATGTDAGKVTVPTGADAGKLATAGDIANAINNSGFKATAGGNTTGATPTQELIKAGDTLTLKAGNGLTVEQSGSTFTYALNAQQITQNAQTPVVYTKADGSKVYKHTDGNFYDQPNGAGTQVAAGDVIASMNAGDNTTSTPTTLANVKGNLADAATETANPANNSRSDFAGKGNNAATVNDVLNAGFNVQGNGVAKDFVTHGDTINFVNGQGTVANVTSTNGVTEVKFDTPLSYADATGNNTTTPSNAVNLVGSDPSKPVTLGNVAEGVKDTDAVNVAQLNAAKTKVQAADNSPVTVTGTGSSTDPYKVGVNTVTLTAPATGTDAGKVTVPTGADAGKLATAGDIANAINNSGFKATAGGNTTGATPTQELIKAGDTLTLKAGNGLTVEQSGSTFTYALNAQQITQNAQTPVVYTKADGSKVYKHTDGNFYDQPNGAGTQVAAGDVIASMNAGDNTTSTPTTLANVKGNLADAATETANPANNSRSDFAGKGNNAATVNDVLNAGFNVQGNGVAKDFVTHGDTINFVNGQGTVANVTSTNGVTEVKFDTPLSYADATGNNTTTPSNAVNLVGSDPSKPVTLGNVAEGVKDTDAVNVAQLNAAKTKVQAADNSPVTVTGTGSSTDPYKVGVNTVTLTAPATGTDAGKVTVPTGADAGKLATAGDIANAINNSGFKATAGGNTTGATPTQELIKAGDTLTLKAGDGLTVEQSGSTFTYALNAQQITQNAQTPVVYTKADGSKVYKHTDGNFYDQPNGAGTQVAAGDVIASMNAGDNTTSTPTTLANVKGNLADAATETANPANNSRSDFAGKGNNAATVNDVLNAGFNVQGNGVAKDFVTHGDTINFVNGQGTVANVTSTNGVTEVKFDTPLSYADATGNNTTTPSNAVNLVGSDPSKPVTLGNVAEGVKDTDAVNVAQLNAAKTKVQAGRCAEYRPEHWWQPRYHQRQHRHHWRTDQQNLGSEQHHQRPGSDRRPAETGS
ncbi:beta strand repeat-containing protein [Neisseria elongata]|nr:hypothetical protein [Neisseria elongata]